MTEILEFCGEFSPPTIGTRSNSVKIAGDGFCQLTDKGLRVQGFKDRRLSKTEWINAVFWVLVCFVTGFFVFFVWFAGLGYVIRLINLRKRKNKRGKPVDILIPWKKISSYSLSSAADKIIIIHLKKFKSRQGTFAGKLFFQVDDSRNSMDFLDFAEELVNYGIRPLS
ncbi:hypothetical protein IQ265_13940 [Nodosilinea sp. LEGE 06152]|uniref:hypothetical protein n=1 Tax=Nodosilinea sp. LEGE 06152 TaxID=2777966 RepID=UPI001882CE87|nr:hypothetical protein [Nodosilinea sp. LEGE 06152]MBE9157918.1 hypothetical protein [Nodosilinea sp. LEGE 06152]